MRGQAQLRRVVHKGFVHHQPAAALHQPRMPLQQALRGQTQARGIVGIDHHQHIQCVDVEVDFLLHDFPHDMPAAPPRMGMLGVTRRQHANLAATAQTRQQLNGTL